MKKSMLAGLLTTLLAASTLLVPNFSANAAPPAPGVYASDAVRYSGCEYQEYRLVLPYASSDTFFSGYVYADDKNGDPSNGDFIYSNSTPPASGTGGKVLICSGTAAGKFTFRTNLNVTYSDRPNVSGLNLSGSMYLRKPKTKTRLWTKKLKKKTYRITMKSTIETPDGYRPRQFADVVLQRKNKRGKWSTWKRESTDSRGSDKSVLRIRKPVMVRAKTPGDSVHMSSTSSKVKLR